MFPRKAVAERLCRVTDPRFWGDILDGRQSMLSNTQLSATGGKAAGGQDVDRLATLVERTVAAVDAETAALRKFDFAALPALGERKGQCLLELTIMQRAFNVTGVLGSRALAGLRDSLEANRKLLECHLAAASELAVVMAQELTGAEADGTYSIAKWRKAPA